MPTPVHPAPVLRQPRKKSGDAAYQNVLVAVQTVARQRRLSHSSKDGSDLFTVPAGSPLAGQPVLVISDYPNGVLVGVSQSIVDNNDTLSTLPWGAPYKLCGFGNQTAFLPITQIERNGPGNACNPTDITTLGEALSKLMDVVFGHENVTVMDALLAL